MKTKILTRKDIATAVELLRQGEVVALPTETVYGLAADITQSKAVRKIFRAKDRPDHHPLIVHVSSIRQAKTLVVDFPPSAQLLAKRFWPGPLTMVFRKNERVNRWVSRNLPTVALRMPQHPIARKVIQRLGRPLAAPSANAHKKLSPTKAQHVLKTLNGKISAVVDGGPCDVGIESTILDMTTKDPTILRAGAITPSMIERAIRQKVVVPKVHQIKVAGNMKIHYRPNKPLHLLTRKQIEEILDDRIHAIILHYSPLPTVKKCYFIKMPRNKAAYTRRLYQDLHHADHLDGVEIIVEMPPDNPLWLDVTDRLSRASSPKHKTLK